MKWIKSWMFLKNWLKPHLVQKCIDLGLFNNLTLYINISLFVSSIITILLKWRNLFLVLNIFEIKFSQSTVSHTKMFWRIAIYISTCEFVAFINKFSKKFPHIIFIIFFIFIYITYVFKRFFVFNNSLLILLVIAGPSER